MFQKVMIFDGGFGSELNKLNFPLGRVFITLKTIS